MVFSSRPHPASPPKAAWLGAALFAFVTLAPRDASAFCRTMTCRDASCETDADGCVTSGKPLYWPTSCIGFSVDARMSRNLPEGATRTAIERAFLEWAERDCGGGSRASLTFSPLADTTCGAVGYRKEGANVHVVTFRDDDWSYRGIDNSLAKTTVTFDASTGEILDADIEVNTASNPVTAGDKDVRYDLQSILTHEVGHLIGLAHTQDFDATMFASYQPGTSDFRTIAEDDVRALCTVYPPGRAAACAPTPRGGLLRSCDAPPADEGGCAIGPPRVRSITSVAILAVLSLLFLGRRRSQRSA